MTRTVFATACFFVTCLCATAGPPSLIAFERGDGIWVAALGGTSAKKVAKGSAPSLSPDGTRLAFHRDTSATQRQIAVVDLPTKHVGVFKSEIPSDNCQRPIWSPDGHYILFEIQTDDNWHLATINADGSGFRYVKKAFSPKDSLFSACWAPDGQSIYAQDMQNLYLLRLDGSELKRWSLNSLLPGFSLSSAADISVSPDGKTLLVDAESEVEAVNVPDWDGLASSLWTINLASEKAERLTPKGTMAWHACWLGPAQILFTSQSAREKEPSIYKMSLPEKTMKLLLKKAQNPSASRVDRETKQP